MSIFIDLRNQIYVYNLCQDQVDQLSTAPLNVVDAVTTEIIGAVRVCSEVRITGE